MLEVDKNTFEAEVLQAPGKVLVDFYGDGLRTLRRPYALCSRLCRDLWR